MVVGRLMTAMLIYFIYVASIYTYGVLNHFQLAPWTLVNSSKSSAHNTDMTWSEKEYRLQFIEEDALL